MLGIDYSAGRPSGRAVAAAGYGFVARYLPNGLVSSRVNLSASEVDDMTASGVAVVMVWESAANRAAAGREAGIADATMAAAQASVVGLPGLPIYFAVDWDVPDYAPAATSPRAKLGNIAGYFDGVASVLPNTRIGVYGGYYAVSRVLDAGLATWAWQTAAWSGGQTDPRIHLYQHVGTVTVGGVPCDPNEAKQAEYGQNTTEDDMARIDDDQFLEIVGWLTMLACTDNGKLPDNWRSRFVYTNGGDNSARDQNLTNIVQKAVAGIPAAVVAALPADVGGMTPGQLADAVELGARRALTGAGFAGTLTVPAEPTTPAQG